MIERSSKNGKKTDTATAVMWVVAGALAGSGDKWLMHQRSLEKHHGGLWEFPGGKVEGAEIPVKALIRELHEELGIAVQDSACKPAGFAEERSPTAQNPIVILLYTIDKWDGEPQALEGEGIGWFTAKEIADLDKPPLDQLLAAQLFAGQ